MCKQLDLLHLTNPSRELLYETRLLLKRTRVPAMNEDITLFLFDHFLVLVKNTTAASESAAAARTVIIRGSVTAATASTSGGSHGNNAIHGGTESMDEMGENLVEEEEDNTGTAPLLRNTVKSKYQYQIYKDVRCLSFNIRFINESFFLLCLVSLSLLISYGYPKPLLLLNHLSERLL